MKKLNVPVSYRYRFHNLFNNNNPRIQKSNNNCFIFQQKHNFIHEQMPFND